MATVPTYQFYRCWIPWTNRITGQSKPLEYYIQMPSGNPPVGGFPIEILMPGGGITTGRGSKFDCSTYYTPTRSATVQGSRPVEVWSDRTWISGSIVSYNSGYWLASANTSGVPGVDEKWTSRTEQQVLDNDYYTYPAVRIIPRASCFVEWMEFGQGNYVALEYLDNFLWLTNQYIGRGVGFLPVRKLLLSLIAGDTIFYSNESCTETWPLNVSAFGWDIGLIRPSVNPDRIYYIGYSLGGLMAIKAMTYLNDLLAGVVAGGFGVDNGTSFSGNFYSINSSKYSAMWKEVLKAKIKSFWHIPQMWHTGEFDHVTGNYIAGGFDKESAGYGLAECFNDLAVELDSESPAYHCIYAKAVHAGFSASLRSWEWFYNYTQENPGWILPHPRMVSHEGRWYRTLQAHSPSLETEPEQGGNDYWEDFGTSLLSSHSPWRSSTLKFDVSDKTQQFFVTGSGENLKTIREWLYEQTRNTQSPYQPTEIVKSSWRSLDWGLDPKIYGYIELIDEIEFGTYFASLEPLQERHDIFGNVYLGQDESLLFTKNGVNRIIKRGEVQTIDLDGKDMKFDLSGSQWMIEYPVKYSPPILVEN